MKDIYRSKGVSMGCILPGKCYCGFHRKLKSKNIRRIRHWFKNELRHGRVEY